MVLIYRILSYVEANENGDMDLPTIEGFSPKQVSYHVGLGEEAGYLKIKRVSGRGRPVSITHLTWKGHEALAHFKDGDMDYR